MGLTARSMRVPSRLQASRRTKRGSIKASVGGLNGQARVGKFLRRLDLHEHVDGQDESHVHIPSPKAPSIIALNKKTGKLAWEDNPVEDRILHGQWASPAVGKVGDVVQVVIGQGDGWVRGYDAQTGKRLWWFDMNPKDSVWPKTRNEVISTPVGDKGVLGRRRRRRGGARGEQEKKVVGTYNMGSLGDRRLVPANGVLFIADRSQLFALKAGAMTKPKAPTAMLQQLLGPDRDQPTYRPAGSDGFDSLAVCRGLSLAPDGRGLVKPYVHSRV